MDVNDHKIDGEHVTFYPIIADSCKKVWNQI